MRKLLLQLDSSRLPSVFDRVVAYDAAADEIMSYGGVAEGDVRDLIHGCLFTRGPKDLKHTAVFIGGADMAAGERLLAAARQAFFGPFSVSLMLDSNGSNTTAVAAVMKLVEAAGDVRGTRAVVVAGTGPVGLRAAGLLAKRGADVVITSRSKESAARAETTVNRRFDVGVRGVAAGTAPALQGALDGAALILNAGPPGVQLLPQRAWAGRPGLKAAADVNAVPPLGIEGIEPNDDAALKHGVRCLGALAIGKLKMRVHRACLERLFERNDLVLDAETIEEVARGLS